MTAKVCAFPSALHVTMVHAIARQMSALDDKRAEELLTQHLGFMWDHLEARGIDEPEIERDVLAFADAVCATLSAERIEVLDRAVAAVTTGVRRHSGGNGTGQVRRPPPVVHVEIARPIAKMLVFMPFRPRHYVRELARLVLSADPQLGETYLRRDLQVIEEDLLGAGADPVAINRALYSLEGAVRAEIWRTVLLGDVRDDH